MAGLGMLLRQLQMNLSKGLDPSTVGNQHPGEKKKFKKWDDPFKLLQFGPGMGTFGNQLQIGGNFYAV